MTVSTKVFATFMHRLWKHSHSSLEMYDLAVNTFTEQSELHCVFYKKNVFDQDVFRWIQGPETSLACCASEAIEGGKFWVNSPIRRLKPLGGTSTPKLSALRTQRTLAGVNMSRQRCWPWPMVENRMPPSWVRRVYLRFISWYPVSLGIKLQAVE